MIVTVQLSVSVIINKVVKSAKATRQLNLPTVPRKGESLLIEYRYTDDNGKEVEGHITPTVRDVSYVLPWKNTTGHQTKIILDCGVPYPCKELAMFEKAVEIWRGAEFDVTIKEEEDDF